MSTKTDPTSSPGWERATLEKLAFASLREQRAARRWKTFVRLGWLAFFIFLAWLGISRATTATTTTSPHTAVVEIKGEIASGADASAEFVVAALKMAFEDAGAKGVVLLINSPGGSPVQAGIISDEIRRLKAKHGKPVYAVVEETCASAAYYIASATDAIYVDKAIVGSIGVLMDGFGFTGTMEKLGVERRLITAGENKGFLDPFSPLSDAQRAYAQQMLEQIHQQFIAVVKAGRGDRLKLDTPGLFSGLFWSGQRSIELGLADHLGNVDYVAREVIKAEEISDYTRRDNVAEKLAKKFGAAMGDASIRALKAVPALR
jgi:protease-4